MPGAGAQEGQTIRVGVTAGPHAEVLDVVKKVAAERGVEIKVVEFTDYVFPNQALANKDLEANSFQHEPYLKNQIAKTGWKLVKVAYTTASPMGFYSKKYKSFADLPEGATVAIQNDPTNGARSLQILANNGIIKLRDPSSVTAGIIDISENPKKLKFVELDAAQLSRSLPDVDTASINNNYAIQAGLDPVRDSLLKGAAGKSMGQHHRRSGGGQGQAMGEATRGCLPFRSSQAIHPYAIQGRLCPVMVSRPFALRELCGVSACPVA